MTTAWKRHVAKWSGCKLCELHTSRKSVVLARGSVPCDVLFIGEAPGESEDVHGKPFVGPAGHKLDEVITRSIPSSSGIRYALTNLVACIPLDEDGLKTAQPEDDCIKACMPRLQEFIAICRPRLIVCVGSLARDWFDQKMRDSIKVDRGVKIVSIMHPAAILRKNIAMQGLELQRCIVTIQNAVEELTNGVS